MSCQGYFGCDGSVLALYNSVAKMRHWLSNWHLDFSEDAVYVGIGEWNSKGETGMLKPVIVGIVVAISSQILPCGAETFNLSMTDASFNSSPEADHLEISDNEDLVYLDGILRSIFPNGHENLWTEKKAIEILRYTSSALELRSNGGSATKILKEGYAICGGLSHVFRILCRRAGIPARYVGAFNLRPLMGSHAISEVYYAGRWHLLDPTFGLFFYSHDEYETEEGMIASFHDLTIGHEDWSVFKVVDEPWVGIYDAEIRSYDVQPAGPDYLREVYKQSIEELYRKYVEETFPVAYGSGDRISFPVDADLRNNLVVSIGEVDGSSRDVVMQGLNGSVYAGSHYLGGSFPPGFHTWTVKSAKGTRLELTYYSVADEAPNLVFQALKGVRLIRAENRGRPVGFVLLVIDTDPVFSVYCPTGTFVVDAMKLERIDQ